MEPSAHETEADLLSDAQLMLRQASRRLAELERLAAETIAASNAPPPGSTAAADHLALHRRLCGIKGDE